MSIALAAPEITATRIFVAEQRTCVECNHHFTITAKVRALIIQIYRLATLDIADVIAKLDVLLPKRCGVCLRSAGEASTVPCAECSREIVLPFAVERESLRCEHCFQPK